MSFEKGSLSFRILFPARKLSSDDLPAFAAAALPPIDTLSEEEMHGWVAGRHLLDRHIVEETAYLGGHLRLALSQVQKKVPPSLLAAECALEELATMEAENKSFLNQQTRREIKRRVRERLLPDMPPQLKGIDFVFDDRSGLLYATATSEKQLDAFTLALSQSVGLSAEPADPETLAVHLERINVRDWPPVSFSENVRNDAVDAGAGRQFLTWLWYGSEMRSGLIDVPDVGEIAYRIEDPLSLVMEGLGAHETVLKKGNPMHGAETRAALLSGKMLKKANIFFARGEEEWSCSFDADTFVFRGLKLPPTESYDRIGRFQERMILLDVFRRIFFLLYGRFVRERADPAAWANAVAEIRTWTKERPVCS